MSVDSCRCVGCKDDDVDTGRGSQPTFIRLLCYCLEQPLGAAVYDGQLIVSALASVFHTYQPPNSPYDDVSTVHDQHEPHPYFYYFWYHVVGAGSGLWGSGSLGAAAVIPTGRRLQSFASQHLQCCFHHSLSAINEDYHGTCMHSPPSR